MTTHIQLVCTLTNGGTTIIRAASEAEAMSAVGALYMSANPPVSVRTVAPSEVATAIASTLPAPAVVTAATAAVVTAVAPVATVADYNGGSGARVLGAARRAWEKRPVIGDACNDLAVAIAQEQRRSVDATLAGCVANPAVREVRSERARIGMTATGMLAVETESGRFVLRGVALRQILARMGMGAGAPYLAALCDRGMAELASRNVNGLLDARLGGDVVLRIREMPRGPEVMCVVTDSYTEHDGDSVARIVGEALRENGMRGETTYDADGARWRVEASACTTKAPETMAKGETFRVGVVVRGKDDGTGGIQGWGSAERLACLNGMCVTLTSDGWNISHRMDSRRIAQVIRAHVREAEQGFERFLTMWETANTDRVIVRAREINADVPVRVEDALPGFYRAILAGARETVRVAPSRENVAGLVGAWGREPGDTRAAVVNGLTRWAHEGDGATAWRADAVASVATRLAASRAPLAWLPESE